MPEGMCVGGVIISPPYPGADRGSCWDFAIYSRPVGVRGGVRVSVICNQNLAMYYPLFVMAWGGGGFPCAGVSGQWGYESLVGGGGVFFTGVPPYLEEH